MRTWLSGVSVNTCMDAFVALQCSWVTEGSLTVWTHIWLLSTVNTQVSLQIPYNIKHHIRIIRLNPPHYNWEKWEKKKIIINIFQEIETYSTVTALQNNVGVDGKCPLWSELFSHFFKCTVLVKMAQEGPKKEDNTAILSGPSLF